MSCKKCTNIVHLLHKWFHDYEGDNGEILLDEDYNKFYIIADSWHKFEIFYCPYCGDKLENSANNQ